MEVACLLMSCRTTFTTQKDEDDLRSHYDLAGPPYKSFDESCDAVSDLPPYNLDQPISTLIDGRQASESGRCERFHKSEDSDAHEPFSSEAENTRATAVCVKPSTCAGIRIRF